jgi:hypothetical protein
MAETTFIDSFITNDITDQCQFNDLSIMSNAFCLAHDYKGLSIITERDVL